MREDYFIYQLSQIVFPRNALRHRNYREVYLEDIFAITTANSTASL